MTSHCTELFMPHSLSVSLLANWVSVTQQENPLFSLLLPIESQVLCPGLTNTLIWTAFPEALNLSPTLPMKTTCFLFCCPLLLLKIFFILNCKRCYFPPSVCKLLHVQGFCNTHISIFYSTSGDSLILYYCSLIKCWINTCDIMECIEKLRSIWENKAEIHLLTLRVPCHKLSFSTAVCLNQEPRQLSLILSPIDSCLLLDLHREGLLVKEE